MLTNCTTASPLLALAAALVAAPLAAQDSTTVRGERQPLYQERVSFGDLNLSRWSGRRELLERVRDASERVCIQAYGPIDASYHIPSGYPGAGMACADRTYRDARPQISAAIHAAKSGRPQIATALVIVAPAMPR